MAKASDSEPEASRSSALALRARPLPRRATLRPEIRAALALEEAGELQEAARVFEYAGEHAQAAVLRIEHAASVRDAGERLDVLREGCARNPGTTPEGRALHRALADALLLQADVEADPSRRRGLQLEAARGLEEADEGGLAGELYEALGLLDRAARAFERAGEIARLELVLQVIERRDADDRRTAALEEELDRAIEEGRRREAALLLGEHVARRERSGLPVAPGLARRLAAIEDRRPRSTRLVLRWNGAHTTIVRGERTFRVGRAPDAELTVAGPRLSRYHVELSLDGSDDAGPALVATDLGSKLGTFWDGAALAPGVPQRIDAPGELGLGMEACVRVHPVATREGRICGALLAHDGQPGAWSLYLPAGGPLSLSPEIVVPARLLFDRGWIVLDLASAIVAELSAAPLPAGASIDLLVGDRIRLRDAPLSLEVALS